MSTLDSFNNLPDNQHKYLLLILTIMNKQTEKKIFDFQTSVSNELKDNKCKSRNLILTYLDDSQKIENIDDAAAMFSKTLGIDILPHQILLGTPISNFDSEHPLKQDEDAFVYPLADGSWIFAYPNDDCIGFWDRRLFSVSHENHILTYRHTRSTYFRYLLIIIAVVIFIMIIAIVKN